MLDSSSTFTRSLLAAALAVLAGCATTAGSAEDHSTIADPEAAAIADASPEASHPTAVVAMKEVKVGPRGQGWDSRYNEATESWELDKHVPTGEEFVINEMVGAFMIDRWNPDHPLDVDAFATNLHEKGFLQFGYVFTETSPQTVPEGWVIKGTWLDADMEGETPKRTFVARNGGLFCWGSEFKTEEALDEAIEACLASH